MRVVVALTVGLVALLTASVGEARAQAGTALDDIDSPDSLLLGPTQGQRKPDESSKLSAPPSIAPPPEAVGRNREISPSERQELLQNRTRESPPNWGTGGGQN